jgi:hypothetical protein
MTRLLSGLFLTFWNLIVGLDNMAIMKTTAISILQQATVIT